MPRASTEYDKIKKDVFNLSVDDRIRLYYEIRNTDIKNTAYEAHQALSAKIAEKAMSPNDINSLIHASRKHK